MKDVSLSIADCAVIIVTYNSARHVRELLESLPSAADGMSLRIVVVDNGSSDATVNVVRQFQGVTCLATGENLGYAAGINLGRKYAGQCSAVLVLNPDVRFEAGALREMFTTLADSEIGLVVPMLLDSTGRRYPSLRREPTLARAIGDALLGAKFFSRPSWLSQMVWQDAPYHKRHSVDWATGAVILVSAACDATVGPWDEEYFLYSEETDYAARARSVGFRVEYVPSAKVRHTGGGSGTSHKLIALMAVSRIRYMEKRGHWPRAFRAIVAMHELLRSGNAGHRAALRAVLRRSSWPCLIQSIRVTSCEDLTSIPVSDGVSKAN